MWVSRNKISTRSIVLADFISFWIDFVLLLLLLLFALKNISLSDQKTKKKGKIKWLSDCKWCSCSYSVQKNDSNSISNSWHAMQIEFTKSNFSIRTQNRMFWRINFHVFYLFYFAATREGSLLFPMLCCEIIEWSKNYINYWYISAYNIADAVAQQIDVCVCCCRRQRLQWNKLIYHGFLCSSTWT